MRLWKGEPMRRDDALRVLREHQAELQALNIVRLALSGSTARDEAGPASDIALLVEFSRPTGLFTLLQAQECLETWFARPVDLVTPDALKPALRERVLREAIDAA